MHDAFYSACPLKLLIALIGTKIRAHNRNRMIIHDAFSSTSTSTSTITTICPHVTYRIIREQTSVISDQ